MNTRRLFTPSKRASSPQTNCQKRVKDNLQKSWEVLKKGDIVEVVAPASQCSDDELKSAMDAVKSMGLIPRLPEHVFGEHPIFSHDDKHRFEFLKSALLSKDSKAIWCLRGGYGSIRLLPLLAKLKKPKAPKLFVGLSDISTLHNFLNQNWKWPTIHGPMLGTFSQRSLEERKEIIDLVFGKNEEVVFRDLQPLNSFAEKKKKIVGPVTGGNLMTVQSSQGTPWEFHAKNAIVFLEEVNERGYRLDRLLVSLQQSGYFKKATAVVLGDFLGGDEADGENFVEVVIQQFAKEVKIPVLRGLKSGHGPLRRPVPFATKAKLSLEERSLKVDTNKYFWKSK